MFPGIENIEHWGTFVCIKNTLSSKIWGKIPQRGRVYVILYTLGQIIKENYSLCNLIKLHFCFLRFRLSWPPQHLHLAFKQLPLLVFSCLDQFGQHDRVIGRSVTASCYRGGCIQCGLESQCVIGLIGKIESTLHTVLPRTSGVKGQGWFHQWHGWEWLLMFSLPVSKKYQLGSSDLRRFLVVRGTFYRLGSGKVTEGTTCVIYTGVLTV